MDYFIAIDSGGTKTETVLFDETGHILYRDLSAGCNALDIGFEAARDLAYDVIARACAEAPEPVCAVYSGMAGATYYGEAISEYIRPRINAGKLRVELDVSNIISGTLGRQEGCCMICGTGSTLAIRRADNQVTRIGGRGYLVDTDGSGFRLGQEVLKMAYRSLDGRCEPSVLTDMLRNEVGISLQDLVPRIYKGGRSYIASFAHLAFEGRKKGDRVSYGIVEKGAECLADMTWAAQRHFDGEFSVVMGGGIFAAFPEYVQLVQAKAAPRAKMIPAQAPPIYGGAVEAMADGGRECDTAFREKFLREYAELKRLPRQTE